MKHRILFAYPEASPLCSSSGIGTFVFEVAHLLAQTGRWDVDILTDLSYGSDGAPADRARAAAGFSAPGITLHDIDRDDGIPCAWGSPVIHRAERFYRAIVRLHTEHRYELIECPDYCAPGFFVVRDKRTSGGFADTKLVTHLHGSTSDLCEWQRRSFLDREELYANYMESYVKKYADAVISPTEFLLVQSRQTGSTVEREFARIGYPMTSLSDAIARAPRRDASRRIVVACAGRLELRKGQDLLALAIKKLHESGALDQRTDFVFCGSDGLGPERDGRMSRTLGRILQGVQNWTIVPAKPRHELQAWLAGAVDICVLPSRADNYPNTALEAARAGCYQVCSNAGGIPELVKDYGLQTLAYHSEDVSMLAEALRQAIRDVQQEPDIRSRLAGNFESQRLHQCRQSVAAYDSLADRGASRSTAPTRGKDFPRVSIIIPFYNAHQHARETLRSAFASNYPNFEVILVNDGSTLRESKDFLSHIANEFPELRIVHKPNGGLGNARNAGLQVATGEFVVPLDADNMILPDMVRCCSRLLSERPDLSYVTTYFECLRDEDGVRIPWRLSPIAKPLGAVDPLLLLENTVGDALAMIRRSHIDLVGGYSTHIYCFEDWDLWLKFHERGMEGDVLPEVHFVYRLRETSMSRSVDAIRGVRLQQALMMQHRNLVQQQAIPITTLLLTEYWTKWRNQKPVQREDQPQDTLIKAMGVIRDHPRWSLSFMAEKIFRRAAGRLVRR